ncbi:MAG: DUF2461 domain-containing protein [Pseudomonadota bacterium]
MTETHPIQDSAFNLLGRLAENNNREWYHEHKAEFESVVLEPFSQMLEEISDELLAEDMRFYGGRNTMFRMNRDVRFSKNKDPYKTNIGGLLTPNGMKSGAKTFVYLHMDSKGGFAAFGRYKLKASALGPIRDRIIDNPNAFAEIKMDLKSNGLDLVREGALKSMPRGYSQHAEHRHADELKLKSMMVQISLKPSDFTSGQVVRRVVETALACREFIEFVAV